MSEHIRLRRIYSLGDLGERIRFERQEMKRTPNSLAAAAGVSSESLTKIEAGSDASMSDFLRVCHALNLSYELSQQRLDYHVFSMMLDDDFESRTVTELPEDGDMAPADRKVSHAKLASNLIEKYIQQVCSKTNSRDINKFGVFSDEQDVLSTLMYMRNCIERAITIHSNTAWPSDNDYDLL